MWLRQVLRIVVPPRLRSLLLLHFRYDLTTITTTRSSVVRLLLLISNATISIPYGHADDEDRCV
eukprot:5986986-Pyramimonas_sp.AAC.1